MEHLELKWLQIKGAYLRLEGSNCPDCGVKHFPARPVCPEPNCPSRVASENSASGVVYDRASTYTDSTTASSEVLPDSSSSK